MGWVWEVDLNDGKKLKLDSEVGAKASLTFGAWDDRTKDITQEVTLPFVLDPSEFGVSVQDGDWFVLKLAFEDSPANTKVVTVEAINPKF